MASIGYPDYWLESYVDLRWVAITPARDLPHYYNDLEKAMMELIRVGKRAHLRSNEWIGYRIICKYDTGYSYVALNWESIPSE